MKEQPEPRFRTVQAANLYLRGRSRADQQIELGQATTTGPGGPQPSATLYFVTLNGALIGRGLTIDDAVSQADDSLNKGEFLPGLF